MATLVMIELVLVTCGGCGCNFGMESKFRQNLVDAHGSFTCPRGCKRHFTLETDKERAEKAATRAQELLASERLRIRDLELKLSASRGQITKIKNRVAAGACPCCNRTFENLARHMKGQHPDFKEAPTP